MIVIMIYTVWWCHSVKADDGVLRFFARCISWILPILLSGIWIDYVKEADLVRVKGSHDSNGWNLLHHAAEKGTPDEVKHLAKTININEPIQNDQNKTSNQYLALPIHLAARNSNPEVIKALIQLDEEHEKYLNDIAKKHGKNPDSPLIPITKRKDGNGFNALHYVVENESEKATQSIISTLIQHGANPCTSVKGVGTPLDYAKSAKNHVATKALEAYSTRC